MNSHKDSNRFPFERVSDVENYYDSSICPVYLLVTEFLIHHEKSKNASLAKKHLDLDHVSSHLSKAQGISNLLRGVAHNSRCGLCYIPSDLLDKHRAKHEDFLRYRETKPIFDTCYDLASIAQTHLDKCKSLMSEGTFPRQYYYIFLPLIFVELSLNRLQKANFNVFHKSLYVRENNLPFKLWFRSLKYRF